MVVKYKLYPNSPNDKDNIIRTVFLNRGVPNFEQYLDLDDSCVEDYNHLDNIDKAAECFNKHFQDRDSIAVLVDPDPDGYCSASIIYNYIKELDSEYPIHYIIHNENKAHGLGGMKDGDFELPSGTKLFIIPDASSNDITELNSLVEQGIECIVLDHHEVEPTNINCNAIIVNNQVSSNYTNKDFSGAGIAYEFIRALDDIYWTGTVDDYLDLVALANISDIMDLRSAPTRYYVNQGLEHINNPMFQALITAQSYSLNGEISPYSVAWYITPILNALIRIGSYEERDLLFKAFIKNYEEFDYKKRGGDVIKENIYDRAARFCKNAKSRQDKLRDKLFSVLLSKVNKDDKVVIIEVEEADSGIVGLSAMKLSDDIKRPVVVLKKLADGRLGGSCRNFDSSPISDLKELLNSTGLFDVKGHANAAGTYIKEEDLSSARELLNSQLKDLQYDSSYMVDFIIDIEDMDTSFIKDIDNLHWVWCTGIKEPLVAVQNITIQRSDIHVQGKENNSIAFECDGIKYVQFKMSEDAPLLKFINDWGEPDEEIKFDIVGTCSINNYQGVLQPQFIIKGVQTQQTN